MVVKPVVSASAASGAEMDLVDCRGAVSLTKVATKQTT